MLGVPVWDEVVEDDDEEPAAAEGADDWEDGVSVFGDGVGDVLRSQPAAKASETAATSANSFIGRSMEMMAVTCKQGACRPVPSSNDETPSNYRRRELPPARLAD